MYRRLLWLNRLHPPVRMRVEPKSTPPPPPGWLLFYYYYYYYYYYIFMILIIITIIILLQAVYDVPRARLFCPCHIV